MFYFTRLTSAVTLTIAGSLKMILLIVVPEIFGEHTFNARNWVGASIYVVGFCAYGYLGHREVAQQSKGATEKTPLSLPQEVPISKGGGCADGLCGRLLCAP